RQARMAPRLPFRVRCLPDVDPSRAGYNCHCRSRSAGRCSSTCYPLEEQDVRAISPGDFSRTVEAGRPSAPGIAHADNEGVAFQAVNASSELGSGLRVDKIHLFRMAPGVEIEGAFLLCSPIRGNNGDT